MSVLPGSMDVHFREDEMTRPTTALLSAGPRTAGAWGDRAWRVALTAQLVSGGSADYWIVTPTVPALHSVEPAELPIEQPGAEFVVDSILLMLAAHLGDSAVEGYLLDSGNISLEGETRVIAPYWDVSAPSTAGYLAGRMSELVRIGITVLDELSPASDEVVDVLRQLGFDVDVFGLVSTSVLSAR